MEIETNTKETIIKDGRVIETLMGGLFKVQLDKSNPEEETKEVIAALSGKLRKFKIRILQGDRVKIEFSPHDLTRGRISYRYR